MNTVENDAYTFTVTVTNVAGPSSEISAEIKGKIVLMRIMFCHLHCTLSYS